VPAVSGEDVAVGADDQRFQDAMLADAFDQRQERRFRLVDRIVELVVKPGRFNGRSTHFVQACLEGCVLSARGTMRPSSSSRRRCRETLRLLTPNAAAISRSLDSRHRRSAACRIRSDVRRRFVLSAT